MFSFILFLVSLLIIVSLLGLRIFEFRAGRRFFISNFLSHFDPLVLRIEYDAQHLLRNLFSHIKRSPESVTHTSEKALHGFLSKLQNRIRNREFKRNKIIDEKGLEREDGER
jgi:hypothetical protein